MLDAGVEAGVDAALAAVVEGSVDPLVADARERRKRLHWCPPLLTPQRARARVCVCDAGVQAAAARVAAGHPSVHASA
jgi:hypothetical protein